MGRNKTDTKVKTGNTPKQDKETDRSSHKLQVKQQVHEQTNRDFHNTYRQTLFNPINNVSFIVNFPKFQPLTYRIVLVPLIVLLLF